MVKDFKGYAIRLVNSENSLLVFKQKPKLSIVFDFLRSLMLKLLTLCFVFLIFNSFQITGPPLIWIIATFFLFIRTIYRSLRAKPVFTIKNNEIDIKRFFKSKKFEIKKNLRINFIKNEFETHGSDSTWLNEFLEVEVFLGKELITKISYNLHGKSKSREQQIRSEWLDLVNRINIDQV